MTGPALLPAWEQLAGTAPGVTVPMRRYLEQIACVLLTKGGGVGRLGATGK